ncbi:hypothetical protein BD769DRAFT_1385051 [Suillus cothurnatus]|nr:hypothetical protein BD769DRAFT_1385051 [Suillus cothurnatus]
MTTPRGTTLGHRAAVSAISSLGKNGLLQAIDEQCRILTMQDEGYQIFAGAWNSKRHNAQHIHEKRIILKGLQARDTLLNMLNKGSATLPARFTGVTWPSRTGKIANAFNDFSQFKFRGMVWVMVWVKVRGMVWVKVRDMVRVKGRDMVRVKVQGLVRVKVRGAATNSARKRLKCNRMKWTDSARVRFFGTKAEGSWRAASMTTDVGKSIAKIDHTKGINREEGKETQRTRMRDDMKYNWYQRTD